MSSVFSTWHMVRKIAANEMIGPTSKKLASYSEVLKGQRHNKTDGQNYTNLTICKKLHSKIHPLTRAYPQGYSLYEK